MSEVTARQARRAVIEARYAEQRAIQEYQRQQRQERVTMIYEEEQ